MTVRSRFAPLGGPHWLHPAIFLGRMSRWQPRLAASAGIVVVLLALVEGVGLTLLLPLLEFLGFNSSSQAPSGPARFVVAGFTAVGLPLTLAGVLGVFFVVGLAQTALHALQQYLIIRAGEKLTAQLRVALFEGASYASWPFLISTKAGQLQNVIVNESGRLGIIYGNAMTAGGLLIIFVMYISLAAWMSWQFTLAVFLLGAVCTAGLARLYRASRRFGAYTSAASSRMQEVLIEHLGAAKLLRLFNAGAQSRRAFTDAVTAVGDYSRRNQGNTILIKASVEPIALLFIVAVLYIAISHKLLSSAETLLFLAIFYRLAPRLVHLQQLYQRVTAVLPAYELIGETLDSLSVARERGGGQPFSGLEHGIELRDVSLTLEGKAVLDHVSMSIPARKTTVLVGASGGGKSTLIDMICGIRVPDSGAILYDGVPLDRIDLGALRDRIGYVPQEGIFFHDTIAANLRLARPDASDNDLWDALERASAADFVRARPERLEAVIGSQGLKLSGGQRQRLALARALLRRPDLLVLDEPTSALDEETERALMESLMRLRGRVTVLATTHRPRLKQAADEVLYVERSVNAS